MTIGLTEKVLEIHRSLDAGALPHAFGGALALALCTADPRGTKDIDLNVFVGVDRLDEVLRSLPHDVEATPEAIALLTRDAQARLWWDGTPVDLFLSNHPFHAQTAANRRTVLFAGVELPVLACPDLAVFKAFFARPKDVVDIVAMVTAGAIDLDHLQTTVGAFLGDEREPFLDRVRDAVREMSR